MIYAVAMLLLIVLDQAVKLAVKTNIPLGMRIDCIPHVLGLTHIHNDGAAFSMLTGARWFFVGLTVAFVAFALWILYTGRISYRLGRWMTVLVIAGAAGNLIDRLLYGYVVDMFELLFMRFAIFNVADILVVVGGIGFCIYYGFLRDRWKERDERNSHENTV